jgi:predicted DCC family thiol-disulfide oxidoreductase YuxK
MGSIEKHPVQLEVFFDGECSLCRREIEWLKSKNKDGKVTFVDIAARDFEATKYGKSWDEFMAEMHGRLPDGSWLVGLDTFDHLYRVLKMGWLVRWTRWSWTRPVADWCYRWFAKNRLRLTGRKTSSCRAAGSCEVNMK